MSRTSNGTAPPGTAPERSISRQRHRSAHACRRGTPRHRIGRVLGELRSRVGVVALHSGCGVAVARSRGAA